MRGLRRRQANVLAFALDRQDARRPVAVDQPCSLCERPGTSGDPVVIRRGEHVAGHRGCLQAHDDRMYAIETALSNPEGGQ